MATTYGINFSELADGADVGSVAAALRDFVKEATGPNGHRTTVNGAVKDFRSLLVAELDKTVDAAADYLEMQGYV